MADTFTETSRQSWISRVGDSFKGMLGGLIAFIIGFPLLFWNEGNSVKTARALDEGEGACVPLESIASVDPDMEGKLVHACGKAETDDVLSDAEFGISAKAIWLERFVEMYQWEESSRTTEKKNLGGSVTKETTYTYSKTWSSRLIDSSNFKKTGHDNPASMEFQSVRSRAKNVRFGAFRLNEKQIARIGWSEDYAFAPDYQCPLASAQRRGSVLYIPGAESRTGTATNTRDVASNPQIGDMRVTFVVSYPHEISIVSKQRGDTFVAYKAKSGKEVNLLEDGTKDAAEMFEAARQGNAVLKWILRVVGLLLMFLGLSSILKPLGTVADVVPFLGTIVGIGTGLVAFIVALVCWLVTIAIAWLFYRPLVGIPLLAVAVALVVFLAKRAKEVKAAKA